MKLNLIARLFKGAERPATRLMTITPPRTDGCTMLGVENPLSSIAVPEPSPWRSLATSAGSACRPAVGTAPSSASGWVSSIPRPR